MTTKNDSAISHQTELPDFTIDTLGKPQYDSPLKEYLTSQLSSHGFIRDDERIVYNLEMSDIKRYTSKKIDPPSMEVAGPRDKNYFTPSKVHAAIVTCGGLCPGINDVIRALYMELFFRYKVKEVIGIRYGFAGLVPRVGRPPIFITQDMVENIHREGGTFLGSSRGPQDPAEMVDFLERERINMLFIIGGDGAQKGGLALAEEIEKRKIKISVIGIPKTIDNDISFVERSFGYRTAVSVAKEVLRTGHDEARGAYNGVAVVKLMGRHSGFIAAMAAVANGDVNFVLVPEIPFDLEGEHGLLEVLERRLEERTHALIVVAEGAGQDIIKNENKVQKRDQSGNIILEDIGIYLRDKIKEHFSSGWKTATVRYIDPSYLIRTAPSNADDSIFCSQLAQNAVHAAMSGRTKMIVSLWNHTFVNVPMEAVISKRKQLNPAGTHWLAVIEATGQPPLMKNQPVK